MDMPKGFKVIGDKVLVRAEMEDGNVDGIIIPDTCRIHDWTAEVVQAGKGTRMTLVGDKVLYSKNDAVIPFSGAQEYRILRERNIIAKLVQEKGKDYDTIFPMFGWLLCKPQETVRRVGEIYLPDQKINKAYCATVVRAGCHAQEYEPGHKVYFDTELAIQCFENDEMLCLTSKHDIQLLTR